MPTPVAIEKILVDMKKYIKQCAEDASKYFISYKISPQVFEGIRMDLSPQSCEMLYKDMIIEMLEKCTPVRFQYGLMVAIIPVKQLGDRILFTIHLGISFPDRISGHPGTVVNSE